MNRAKVADQSSVFGLHSKPVLRSSILNEVTDRFVRRRRLIGFLPALIRFLQNKKSSVKQKRIKKKRRRIIEKGAKGTRCDEF